MSKERHNRLAKELERKLGEPYNPGEGPDFDKPGMPMDVKVDIDDLKRSIRSMSQRKGLPYFIVPNDLKDEAAEILKNTRIGLRDPNLKIIKAAKRKKTR